MREFLRFVIILIAVLLPASMVGQGADGVTIDFDLIDIEAPGNINHLGRYDFNGDGLIDLVLLQKDRMHFYYQQPGRRFPAQPSETLFPGKQMVMVDFADMNNDGKTNVVIAGSRGVYYLEYKDGSFDKRFNVICRDKVRFRPVTAGSFPWLYFIYDMNGDGHTDFWLPRVDGIVIYYGGENGFTPGEPIELLRNSQWKFNAYPSALQSVLLYNFRYGDMRFIDFNNDKRNDLVYVTEEALVIFLQQEDGRFASESYDVMLPEEKHGIVIGYRPMRIADLNADGYPDLVYQVGDEGAIKIYMGKKNLRSFSRPVQIIREKGYVYTVHVVDINHDGYPDLFTEQAGKINWAKALRIFLAKETSTYVQVYLNDSASGGDSIFHKRHDYIESFDNPLVIQLSYSGIEDVDTRMFVNAWHDFSNDGQKDLIALTDERQFSLYLAREGKELYPKKPDFNYTIPDTEPYIKVRTWASDLDGDHSKDVIIQYFNVPGKPDKILVCFSTVKPK